MIKFTALYPNQENVVFDFECYMAKHIPLTLALLGSSVQKSEVDKGISGSNGAPAPYIAMGHLYFESLDSFRRAFLPHLEEFRKDIANFSSVQPVVQISEVVN
jgi:uncharacterized protein (TIGR02118 family)